MNTLTTVDAYDGPVLTINNIIVRFTDALERLLEDRPKKRKHLKLVHYDRTPTVRQFGESHEHGCVFTLKISSGVRFSLVGFQSERAYREFISSCRTANCFVPAIVPTIEEDTPSLAHRIKQLIRRMVRSVKHTIRRCRRCHPGRFSRARCNTTAQRTILPATMI